MKIRNHEKTSFFNTVMRRIARYRGDPTNQEMEKLAECRGRGLLVIKIRWIFLLFVGAYGLYAGSLLLSSRPEYTVTLARLVMPTCILMTAAAYNLFYRLFYRNLSVIPLFNNLQILLDMLITTSMIHYTGGIFSPFWAVYPFLALEASLLVDRRRDAWIFCTAASVTFGMLITVEAGVSLHRELISFITENLLWAPLYSILLWSWVTFMTVAMTLIGFHVVRTNRAKEITLKQLAVKDQMTKLYNRSYFFKALNSEIQRSSRYNRVFSIAFLDIDHFKEFNDSFGHLEGDRLIQELAGILRRNVRRSETEPSYDIDIPCRYGGEEFGVILPETPLYSVTKRTFQQCEMSAESFAERIRKEIESLKLHGGSITVSIGLASFPRHGATPDELVKSADEALYRAKKDGKNRIVIADPPNPPDQNGISSSGLNTGSSYSVPPAGPESSGPLPAP